MIQSNEHDQGEEGEGEQKLLSSLLNASRKEIFWMRHKSTTYLVNCHFDRDTQISRVNVHLVSPNTLAGGGDDLIQ